MGTGALGQSAQTVWERQPEVCHEPCRDGKRSSLAADAQDGNRRPRSVLNVHLQLYLQRLVLLFS